MRESIGGLFLIKIMVVFLVLYNSLLAIAVNYAMVFRVKNQIINYLEQYEGCTNAMDKIDTYVSSMGYYRASSSSNKNKGYTIEPLNTVKGTYYVVTTYIKFDFPIVHNVIEFPVKGETRIIYGLQETTTQCGYKK